MKTDKDMPEWVKYVEGDGESPGFYQLVSNYLEKHVDKDVTNYLQVVYGFYSFYTENLKDKVTKNNHHWDDASLFLIYVHDCMRALITLHSLRHMSPAAFTVRSILESWITAKYIFLDPKKRFDLYRRYEQIEKYSAHKRGTNDILSDEQAAKIKADNPEWFYINKKTGEEGIRHSWTVEKKSIRAMAEEVGLLPEYEQTYSNTSIFTHCGSILRNSYKGKDGLSPIPVNDQTTYLVLTGTQFGLNFLEDFYAFFGIDFPHDQRGTVKFEMLKLKKYNGMTDEEYEEFMQQLADIS